MDSELLLHTELLTWRAVLTLEHIESLSHDM